MANHIMSPNPNNLIRSHLFWNRNSNAFIQWHEVVN